jgi:divinyl protochlorophyllide a 8-vinyl-reductase
MALKLLPARLALPILLKAVTRNAWTFAGAANVTSGADWRGQGWIAIDANPICNGVAGLDGCHWHKAVFQRLFAALVSTRVSVTETHCVGRGDAACRFAIRLT